MSQQREHDVDEEELDDEASNDYDDDDDRKKKVSGASSSNVIIPAVMAFVVAAAAASAGGSVWYIKRRRRQKRQGNQDVELEQYFSPSKPEEKSPTEKKRKEEVAVKMLKPHQLKKEIQSPTFNATRANRFRIDAAAVQPQVPAPIVQPEPELPPPPPVVEEARELPPPEPIVEEAQGLPPPPPPPEPAAAAPPHQEDAAEMAERARLQDLINAIQDPHQRRRTKIMKHPKSGKLYVKPKIDQERAGAGGNMIPWKRYR